MKHFLSTLLLLAVFNLAFAQSNYTVQLQGTKNLTTKPYLISVVDQVTQDKTDLPLKSNGTYSFTANAGDFFIITNLLDQKDVLKFKLGATTTIDVGFVEDSNSKAINSGAAISSRNYWIGASIAYNVQGESSNDIVGGTKVIINAADIFEDDRNHLNIIGNVGTFFANTNKDDNSAALSKLAQSQTGLSIGLAYRLDLRGDTKAGNSPTNPDFSHTFEFATGYRLNSFKDPKIDTNTIGLSQLRTSILYELAILKWGKKGHLTLGFEGSMSRFSSTTYEQIFGYKKKTRFTFETTAILPISENIGFMANIISSQNMRPVYQFGFLIKNIAQ
ncbi:MAG: hypothetical protein EOO42_15280 [Flavobacteriales bacterium]|nr:MAG: hypothetical protein EOO42_15280 [Flavobacteriales bacterium]